MVRYSVVEVEVVIAISRSSLAIDLKSGNVLTHHSEPFCLPEG